MLIQGKMGQYECRWVTHGYSYAKIHVYAVTPIDVSFFGLFKRTILKRKLVWETSSSGSYGILDLGKMEKMLPNDLRRHYQSAVDEYEKYTEAWAKEHDTIEHHGGRLLP